MHLPPRPYCCNRAWNVANAAASCSSRPLVRKASSQYTSWPRRRKPRTYWRYTQKCPPPCGSFTTSYAEITTVAMPNLYQTQSFCRCMQVFVTREIFFTDGPIGPLAEPTEMQVDSSGVESLPEAGRSTVRPARTYVSALASTHDVSRPVFSFRQGRQIDFPRSDCGRFPVHDEHTLASN